MKKLKALVAVGATVALLGSATPAEAGGAGYGTGAANGIVAGLVVVTFVTLGLVATNSSKGTANH